MASRILGQGMAWHGMKAYEESTRRMDHKLFSLPPLKGLCSLRTFSVSQTPFQHDLPFPVLKARKSQQRFSLVSSIGREPSIAWTLCIIFNETRREHVAGILCLSNPTARHENA